MKLTPHLTSASIALLAACSLLSSPVRAGLNEGVAAYQAGNVPLAYKEFFACAQKGDAGCQFNVALMYEQGIGVSKDEKEAVVWYRKSADQGNSYAQFNLGVMYYKGEGVPKDDVEAYMWALLAAAQGHEKAKAVLDSIGRGMTSDQITEARKRAAIWQPAPSKQ